MSACFFFRYICSDTSLCRYPSTMKNTKIAFLDSATLGDSDLSPIKACGQLICWPTSTPEEALERVSDCEILIINKVKVTAQLIDAAPHLKLICEAATGVNNIDLEHAKHKNIPVLNVAGYSTETVVQTTFMLLLSLAGKLPYFDRHVKSGDYTRSGLFTDMSVSFTELYGKTIGIIGMGHIGSKVAHIATAFGMKVVYFSTSGTSHCKEYPSLSIEELLTISDIVSIHAPLNERTNHLIDADKLKLMKQEAYLINMGRGGIVEEEALAQAVDNGIIAGAGLDVFTEEPLPKNHPFLTMKHPERMLFTPHIGWASTEARIRLVAAIAGNIHSIFG